MPRVRLTWASGDCRVGSDALRVLPRPRGRLAVVDERFVYVHRVRVVRHRARPVLARQGVRPDCRRGQRVLVDRELIERAAERIARPASDSDVARARGPGDAREQHLGTLGHAVNEKLGRSARVVVDQRDVMPGTRADPARRPARAAARCVAVEVERVGPGREPHQRPAAAYGRGPDRILRREAGPLTQISNVRVLPATHGL